MWQEQRLKHLHRGVRCHHSRDDGHSHATVPDWKANAQHVQFRWNVPHVLRALDGKHIALKPPTVSSTTTRASSRGSYGPGGCWLQVHLDWHWWRSSNLMERSLVLLNWKKEMTAPSRRSSAQWWPRHPPAPSSSKTMPLPSGLSSWNHIQGGVSVKLE